MDKRFVTFLLFAFLLLTANMLLMNWMGGNDPPPQAQGDGVAAGEAPDADQALERPAGAEADPDKAAAEGDPPPDGEQAPDDDPADVEIVVREAEGPTQFFALGSVDPNSPYRLLATFTSRGAAIERIELSSARFRDVDNHAGYLGHLALEPASEEKGLRVRVVGPGTPAALAGVRQDDVLLAVDETKTADLEAFDAAMAETEPGDEIELTLLRDGATQTLTAALAAVPLEVVRPEADDPASLLLSLAEVDGRPLGSNEGGFRDGNWEVVEQSADQIAFRRSLEGGVTVVKRYRLEKTPDESLTDPDYPGYHVALALEFSNTGETPHTIVYQLDGPTGLPIEGWWYAHKISPNWGGAGMRDVMVGYSGGGGVEPKLISASTIAKEELNPDWTPLAYIGVDAQYFSAVLIPQKLEIGERWLREAKPIRVGAVDPEKVNLVNASFRVLSQPIELEPDGQPVLREFVLFAGPKKPALMAHYGLSKMVYYGWFGWVAKPMLAVLHMFYALVGNYGLAIIMLTVLVRSCMFPLSRKQALGAQKMQQLAPEMKAIGEKYKANPEQRMKAQQELFRKHNYNPLAGCLPLFIQMPIFIGLYRSLMVDVELRQAPLIPGVSWCSDLAAPDMLWNWSGLMPGFVVHYLGEYLNVLPLITVGLFIWQQKMFMPPPTDEQSALQQKMMRYMMIFMAFLFYKVAAGLCLYFIASSLWGIAERKLLPKTQPAAAAGAVAAPRPAVTASGNGAAKTSKKKKQRGRK